MRKKLAARRRGSFCQMETLEERTLLSVSMDTSTQLYFAGADAPTSTALPPAGAATVTTIPLTIQAVSGTSFTGDVGEIKGLSPSLLPRLRAVINWGDLPTASSVTGMALSPGTLRFDTTGLLHVGGTHTYMQPGTFPVTVSVTLAPPGSTLGPVQLFVIHSSAVVTGDSRGGVTITAAVNHAFTAIVGKFNLPLIPIASPVAAATPIAPVLKASISWGDGTTSVGTIVPLPTTTPANTDPTSTLFNYGVQGTHTYTAAGTYPIVVTVYEQYPFVGPTPVSAADPSLVRLIATIDSTANVFLPPTALS